METTYRIKYRRADGTEYLSSGLPYADKRSAEAIAAIGRVTGPDIGIVSCEVVPEQSINRPGKGQNHELGVPRRTPR